MGVDVEDIVIFGTCAGMVLLSKKTDFNQH